MGTLVTLGVAVVILAVVARTFWPRNARAPFPLYVGTIAGAFLIGLMAGSLADGRDFWRSLQSALILAPVIGAVAALSWLRVKPPDAAAEPKPAQAGARRRRGDRRE